MKMACPSCGNIIEQNSAPIRGPVQDGSEMWLCLKCPAPVCGYPDSSGAPCYIAHTEVHHPQVYRLGPTVDSKKNKKGKKGRNPRSK